MALNLAQTTPTWLRSLGASPMKLGLDLQGGVHFLLEVDMDKAMSARMKVYEGEVKTLLRKERIRYRSLPQQDGGIMLGFSDDATREHSWQDAFADIGTQLKRYDPTKVVFYASGRASLETSYMWQLMARMYGSQNLPDSSNMCHETTSVGLKSAIGSPVGRPVSRSTITRIKRLRCVSVK